MSASRVGRSRARPPRCAARSVRKARSASGSSCESGHRSGWHRLEKLPGASACTLSPYTGTPCGARLRAMPRPVAYMLSTTAGGSVAPARAVSVTGSGDLPLHEIPELGVAELAALERAIRAINHLERTPRIRGTHGRSGAPAVAVGGWIERVEGALRHRPECCGTPFPLGLERCGFHPGPCDVAGDHRRSPSLDRRAAAAPRERVERGCGQPAVGARVDP